MMKSYQCEGGKTWRVSDEGERECLANFIATITEETRYIDGEESETRVTVEGSQGQGETQTKLPAIEMEAGTFASMGWVMSRWGVRAILAPGGSVKEDLRAAIQMSSVPRITTVYRHLGWETIAGKKVYLHANGGVGEKGNDKTLRVSVPPEMRRYDLTDAVSARKGVEATIGLLETCPVKIGWPLLAGTLAPLFGPVDFAMHLTGRTGTFKSEICSLWQSHYGTTMDARSLPGSWSSTANALECQAHIAKNAVVVIDDFVPSGTGYQQKAYQTAADRLVRAQGNQAGRARLTDMSDLRGTMYPRGMILSTGEDTPEGHSCRARMLILEVSPGDVSLAKLTQAQARRREYTGTVAGLVQKMATDPKAYDVRKRIKAIRDKYVSVGHSRTPTMVGHLVAVAEAFCDFAVEVGASKSSEQPKMLALADILAAGEAQNQYLEQADPVEQFMQAVRVMLTGKSAHLRTLRGGPPPKGEMMGWVTEDQGGKTMPMGRSFGPCIGWIDWDAGEIYIEANGGFALIKKQAGNEMTLSKQTLLKRLKEAGALTRSDDVRQRNTVRIVAEGHTRQVICLPVRETLQVEEMP